MFPGLQVKGVADLQYEGQERIVASYDEASDEITFFNGESTPASLWEADKDSIQRLKAYFKNKNL